MLAAFGVFPISVALAAFVVRHFGPAAFFPLAAGAIAVAVGGGLAHRTWRNLGTTTQSDDRIRSGVGMG
jgi:hypothetical protein